MVDGHVVEQEDMLQRFSNSIGLHKFHTQSEVYKFYCSNGLVRRIPSTFLQKAMVRRVLAQGFALDVHVVLF